MTMNEGAGIEGLNNVCDGCIAAHCLGIFTEEVQGAPDPNISKIHDDMLKNEAIVAREALEKAAGIISCKDIRKTMPELPTEIPEVGSKELIALVSQCPAMPYYVYERTGQSVRLTKLAFGATKIVRNIRRQK